MEQLAMHFANLSALTSFSHIDLAFSKNAADQAHLGTGAINCYNV
jgi:hypothetical protein